MLTIHRVRAVRLTEGGEPDAGHAVVVSGGRFAAIGPYEELLAEYGERARVREWEGVLTPGRYEPDGPALLERTYWPDPREAGELGTGALTGDAITGPAFDDSRWGASARRGVQRLLAAGTTALSGPFTRASVRTAVHRSGIRVLPLPLPPGPRPRALTPSGAADFAVFDEDRGCLVTALGGRLVYRRA
ncbi:imidazolonepropionase-like domain-containing protein [Streptomyces sp. 7N604]|uniref:imidazolonepropionase-like domain-containing protein n=1 Tax=Streptomyces sp. 7N604 TaxID=3457415 RepID=UPI003FD6526A